MSKLVAEVSATDSQSFDSCGFCFTDPYGSSFPNVPPSAALDYDVALFAFDFVAEVNVTESCAVTALTDRVLQHLQRHFQGSHCCGWTNDCFSRRQKLARRAQT